jgi:lipopolysaccharide export system protein LptA
VLTFLLLIAVTAVVAQKKSVINLIKSESIQGVKLNGVDVLKVYGGTFQQDYSTLRSDSAYFHQKENTFDAFGHVVITQGDTLNIYSDKLNYNGNTKVAILTDHVRMVDKDATLTTDYLTYNTATRIGTYTGGGKLVNKDNTLTSKNGYYFAYSRDSYFRYNVRLVTSDALIITDTLRYNSGSRIAYFYGPTNIYGKKGGKDNDTLYTENGLYNTITEQAFFGKKNLYKQGTKTLHGDSMFYDRKKGYGRVVKNVTFNDNEQKMTLKGDLATYFKADERTVVTQNAYAIIVTEEKDTTKNDSVAAKPLLKGKNTKKSLPDTARIASDKKITPDNKPKDDNKWPSKAKPQDKAITTKDIAGIKRDSVKSRKENKVGKVNLQNITALKKDTGKIKHDSIYMTADTLETRILTFKDLKALQEKRRLANIKDTTKKAPSIVYKKAPKVIELSPPAWIPDSTHFHSDFFGKPKPKPASVKKPEKAGTVKKLSKQDSIKLAKQDSIKKSKTDSVYVTTKVLLSDTARVRILSAFHHTKIFKSDLQGKSDSAFYSNSDSTIRLYVQPIIWTQGSQLTGDTINLQMKNKKLDNMEQFPSAFIVNVEKGDSIHFNQVAGKKMRGFFKNDKLERMFVDGNAETIYFTRDSGKVSGMHRSLSSRIRLNFKDNKVSNLTFLTKPEHRYGPLEKFAEEDKILKGFLWKPKERPVSKEAIIPSLNKNWVRPPQGKPAGTAKPSSKKPGAKTGKDTSTVKPVNLTVPGVKGLKDSALNSSPKKIPDIKSGKDSSAVKPGNLTIPVIKTPRDSTSKSVPAKTPAIQTKKDSTAVTKPIIKQG